MDLLIAAATRQEIQPLLNHFGLTGTAEEFMFTTYHGLETGILITGVGMVATAIHIAALQHSVKLIAINAGIAGTFNPEIGIGRVLRIHRDIIADLGAEHNQRFIPLRELSMENSAVASSAWVSDSPGPVEELLGNIPVATGITVNTVSGNPATIGQRQQLYQADTESMEGAAFLLACRHKNIPCLQLRAVSNAVEPRNLSRWNIPLATGNLCRTLIGLIDRISETHSK